MGSNCLGLDASHIILPKDMFGYPLKLFLEFSRIFCISSIKPKYSHTIMYECEKLH
jgi:hypothetical protein